MTGPEVTAAMKAEDVDAGLVGKAAEAMNAHAPAPADDLDARFGLRNGCSCGQMNSREGRQAHVAAAALAAVLPEIQAQALRDEADRAHTYHFSTGDRVEPVHSERARHLLHERAARLTTTTEEPS